MLTNRIKTRATGHAAVAAGVRRPSALPQGAVNPRAMCPSASPAGFNGGFVGAARAQTPEGVWTLSDRRQLQI